MTPSETRINAGLWWDRACSLVEGCTPVSVGCDHCWSAAMTHVRAKQKNPFIQGRYQYLTEKKDGIVRFNNTVRTIYEDLDKPLRTKKPAVWAVWNDLYHPAVPWNFVQAVYNTIGQSQIERDPDPKNHLFIICTKRPERIVPVLYGPEGRHYLGGGDYFRNVVHITTTENQEQSDRRIPELLKVKEQSQGWIIGISIEPMLGPVDLRDYLDQIDWVIVGGETGRHARPMHPAWVRKVRDDCIRAGIPFFFKHWGEWAPCDYFDGIKKPGLVCSLDGQPEGMITRAGKKKTGRRLDGRTWDQFPGEMMRRKLAEIRSCTECPFEGWDCLCTKNPQIQCNVEIPEACPLPDASDLYKLSVPIISEKSLLHEIRQAYPLNQKKEIKDGTGISND